MQKSKSTLIGNRRQFLATAGAAMVAAPFVGKGTAWAAGKTLNISTYTSVQGEYIAKQVIPSFEKQFDCKVVQRQSTTLPTISVLRTEKASPTLSVAMMDDIGIPIAKGDGLIAKLPADKMPNLQNAYSRFIYEDGFGVAFAVCKSSPWYNSSVITKPMTSWNDLWDESLRGRLLLPSAKLTQSIMLLAMAASIATGKPVSEAQHQLSDGWARMKELRPNVQTMYEATGTAILQVAQGQADVAGPDLSKSMMAYIDRGATITMMSPKEGSFAGVNAMTLTANAPEPDLGAAFLDKMLSTEVQAGLAEMTYAAPPVRGVTISKKVMDVIPTSEEDLAKLHMLDWNIVNPQRAEIIDMFNQIFG